MRSVENIENKHRHGDTREDGYRFWGYHPKCIGGEWWVSQEKWDDLKEKALKRRREVSGPQVSKRVTVPRPNFGDTREDGYRFHGYDKKKGRELWKSPEAWNRVNPNWSAAQPRVKRDTHSHHIAQAFHNAKRRARESGMEFDLTFEFLMEIFPVNGLCPMTREPMVWGSADGWGNSPSIDRMNNQDGYLKDNVWWLSFKANRMKATMDRMSPAYRPVTYA